ncbi:hypothetical protein MRX96_001367 [Rhipicephalus microplus]
MSGSQRCAAVPGCSTRSRGMTRRLPEDYKFSSRVPVHEPPLRASELWRGIPRRRGSGARDTEAARRDPSFQFRVAVWFGGIFFCLPAPRVDDTAELVRSRRHVTRRPVSPRRPMGGPALFSRG